MNIYPPRRHHKAMNLTAHIMHVIDKHLPYNDETNSKSHIARELEDLFYASGVDIITEADRIAAGCMPRDHNGITLEEIKIMDALYKQSMLKQFTPVTVILNEENKNA